MKNCIPENIIGLSDTECECFDLDKPADFNESESGLFITDVFELNDSIEMSNCGNGSIWDMLDKARQHGILEFKRNYKKMFQKRFRRKLSDCKTQVGSDKLVKTDGSFVIESANTFVGIELDSRNHTGTCIDIRQINTFFEATGTVDLMIYSNYSETPIHTLTLNTQAGVKRVNKISDVHSEDRITLPLYEEGCDDLRYYFIFAYDENNRPLNNKCSCGCASKMCYNRYYDMKGVEYANAPEDFERYTASRSSCYGIELVVTAYCDEAALYCPIDYNTDSGVLVAQLIQYEAALYMTARALTGQLFNYDKETLSNKKSMLKEYIHNRYDDLVNDMIGASEFIDCIQCKGGGRNTML